MLLAGTIAAAPAAPAAAAEPACQDGQPIAPGLCLMAEATMDAFAGLRGGVRRGATAIGVGQLGLSGDLGVLAGLDGWRFNASAYAIYGQQSTRRLAGSLTPPSNLEAVPSLRLGEVWLERSLGGWGSIRFGQVAADLEFTTADTADKLISYNWPTALATSLPGGGPAYPLPVPGIRLALGDPDEGTGLRLGLYGGSPAGQPGEGTDPQKHNRFGTIFPLNGGALMIAEAVTGAPAPEEGPRPWVAKLGGWFHNGGVDAQRRDAFGVSLADPGSSGAPRRYGHNYGGYAIGEATLWRGEASSLGVFSRVFAQPGDRNLVSGQVDLGMAWRGPFGRAQDTLSLGLVHARIGDDARALDRDLQRQGEARPRRSQETLVEVNYDWSVIPDHLSVRPLLQWINRPAAGEPDPRYSGTKPLRDAVLLGMRVTATF